MTRDQKLPCPENPRMTGQIDGLRRVATRYGIVFHKADDRVTYRSHQALGHDGPGCSISIAGPWHGVFLRLDPPAGCRSPPARTASAWPGSCATAPPAGQGPAAGLAPRALTFPGSSTAPPRSPGPGASASVRRCTKPD